MANMAETQENIQNLPSLEVNRIKENIPLSRIIELRNKSLSYSEIGAILGCSEANLCQRLRPFRHSIDNLKSIKDNRADTLTVISDTLLTSLSEDEIKKASAYQRVGMFGVLYDKERLERGQSTENIAYNDMTRSAKALAQEIQDLQAKLGISAGQDEADHKIQASDDDEQWTD